eukprot:1145119-Pelagomonas_calceolata.AAC.4
MGSTCKSLHHGPCLSQWTVDKSQGKEYKTRVRLAGAEIMAVGKDTTQLQVVVHAFNHVTQ